MSGSRNGHPLDNLRLSRCQYRLRPPGWSYPWSYHRYENELYICWSGSWLIELRERQLLLEKHQAFLIPPRVAHTVRVKGKSGAMVMLVHFRARRWDLAALTQEVVLLRRTGVLAARRLLDLLADGDLPDAQRRAWLALLLADVLRTDESGDMTPHPQWWPEAQDPLVRRVTDHLAANLRSPLPVAELRALTGYSASRLREVFRQRAGMSLTEALAQLRLEEAQRLLLHSAMKVSAIAREVGFQYPPKFHQFFRKRTGITPRQYALAGQGIGRTWSLWHRSGGADEVMLD